MDQEQIVEAHKLLLELFDHIENLQLDLVLARQQLAQARRWAAAWKQSAKSNRDSSIYAYQSASAHQAAQIQMDQEIQALRHHLHDLDIGIDENRKLASEAFRKLATSETEREDLRQQRDALAAALKECRRAISAGRAKDTPSGGKVYTQYFGSAFIDMIDAALAAATEAGAGDGVQRAAAQHAAGTERERRPRHRRRAAATGAGGG